MKVLIGYDGTESSKSIIDELKTAGLPDNSEVFVVLANESLIPPPNIQAATLGGPAAASTLAQIEAESQNRLEQTKEILESASTVIQEEQPKFSVTSYTVVGDSADVLVSQAKEKEVDLIIVGSHNRSAIGRLFLGSVSKEVVAKAHCSVRVARGKTTDDSVPQRIVIGVDVTNSDGDAPLLEVLKRRWEKGTLIHLVTATDGTLVSAAQAIEYGVRARDLHAAASAKLSDLGLVVTSTVKEGSASDIIISEANKFGADCIFLGTRNLQGALQRYFKGGVSDKVVNNATCSVEIVR